MRVLAVMTLCALGCASTLAGSRSEGPDASPPDAAPTANLELTVLLDTALPGAPGPDVPVRVEALDGPFLEARTGPDGRVTLSLDPARVYDVTVASAGHVALSLLGARVPLRTTVRLPPQRPVEALGVARVAFPVTLTGRSAPRSAVVLEGASGTTVARDDTVSLSVPRWTGAPEGFDLSAMELDEASNILRGGFTHVASRAAPGAVTLALDLAPRVDTLSVELPFVGRLTPLSFGRATPGSVLRFQPTVYGEGAVPVGVSTLAPPDPGGVARWRVTRFEPPLAPELTTVTFVTREAPALVATVTMQPPFEGLVPAFPPVERLASRSPSPGEFAFTADSGGWSRACFEVQSSDATALWRGFAVDAAPWLDRRLPALPSSVERASVLGRGRLRARVCVATDAPQVGVNPWSHPRPQLPYWSRLSVCDEGASTESP